MHNFMMMMMIGAYPSQGFKLNTIVQAASNPQQLQHLKGNL